MKRMLTSHMVSGLNEFINVIAMDDPGMGEASHRYLIEPIVSSHPQGAINSCDIRFQDGPIGMVGVNGVSNESLLAVVEDRLLGFQSGKFSCRENSIALTKLQEAMMWLHKRTRDRVARGVEGQNEP